MAAAGPGPGAGGAVKTLALVLEDEARRGGGGGGGYCSGDTVSGQVLLELAGPLPLRGLRLEAAGRARVAWSESPGAVPGAGTWGVAVRAPGPGPRREAEVRYLDIRQSLLRDPPEGEAARGGMGGAGPAAPAAAAGVGPGEWRCGSREGLREGAHGRQRGGSGGGNALGGNGHRGPKERAPAAGAGRALPQRSAVCMEKLPLPHPWPCHSFWGGCKNAGWDWNKIRSSIPPALRGFPAEVRPCCGFHRAPPRWACCTSSSWEAAVEDPGSSQAHPVD